MMRTRRLNWLAFCVILLLPLAAIAGESPLSQLPADTPVVISIHGIERTQKRLAALIEKAVPDLAPAALAHMKEMMEKGLEGRKLAGLDPDGPVFIAITALPQAGSHPPGAIVAKVTDYKAFRKGILTDEERKNLKKEKDYDIATIEGKEIFMVHRKGYVVLAAEKEVAEQFNGLEGAGLGGKMNKQVAARLLECDAGLYVNMAAVNKQYGEMLTGVKQLIPAMLENAPGQSKSMVKFMKAYIEGTFQAIEDSKHLLVTLTIPPEGLALHIDAGFGKDTSTNKFLTQLKPAHVGGLDNLPPGFLAYAGIAPWGQEAFKTIEPMLRGFFGVAEGADAKALDKALDDLAAAGPGEALMASGLRGGGLQVARYKDPDKAADAMYRIYKALRNVDSFGTMALKEKPVIKRNAETYRGVKFNHFSLKWDLEKQFENLPGGAEQMIEATKKLTGEGVNGWFGAVDGAVVSVQAKDWKAAEKVLERYLDKKATVAAKYKDFDRVRQRLPEKSTIVALVSVPRMVDTGAQYLGTILQGFTGRQAPTLPASKEAEPFIGVSITLQARNAGMDVWIPAETAASVRRVVEAFKGAAQGQ
jgi:hypothetical protein